MNLQKPQTKPIKFQKGVKGKRAEKYILRILSPTKFVEWTLYVSIEDFKIGCIIWVCVLFQLFYSVTVDSFWQFRINSFLGCAQEEGGGRYPVSTWHGWLPRDEVYSVYSAVYSGLCGALQPSVSCSQADDKLTFRELSTVFVWVLIEMDHNQISFIRSYSSQIVGFKKSIIWSYDKF